MDHRINSDTIIPTEQNFRVSAGPGAGKTHWLISHIFNVLQKSNRLGKTRKIACITYTNVAVSTILNRLTTSSDKVEVSTIHSFLYKHIVKPYVHFVADDYNLDVSKMDGHDDIILSNYSFLYELKEQTKQLRITDNKILVDAISHARWKFNSKKVLDIKPDYPRKIGQYAINNQTYLVYKRMAWEKGVLHHDDVLFFSYQLLIRYPFILNVLRAKFPYFFIDEFQDSNPIQVEIIKKIGKIETIIGIIGDKAQSIYRFQGADIKQFDSFKIKNIRDYSMLDNRRSTNQIIDCLNLIRIDFQQNKFRNIEGDEPIVFVGEFIESYKKARIFSNNAELYSLSYTNIMSNIMKKQALGASNNSKLLSSLKYIDSNKDRQITISSCIKATELALQGRFKEAIKILSIKFINKKVTLEKLAKLINEYAKYCNGNMLSYRNYINDYILPISSFRKGKIKDFYEENTYQSLALCVNIIDDDSVHRTIHKAKGAEFNNVILILDAEKEIDFLLSPDLEKEEHRVYYVALSRAKKRLFIAVPFLNKDKIERLQNMNFRVITNEKEG